MRTETKRKDHIFQLLEHFLCAGTCALLLSIAHIYPEYWFISLFALVPFLWRLNRVNLPSSFILGIMLASCYAFITFKGEVLVPIYTFVFRFFYLSLIFSVFAIMVNRLKRYIGFSPVFVAALWLLLEYILRCSTGLGNILTLPNSGAGFVVRFASLFGFLMVSFGIVLINSLIMMFIEYVGKRVFQAENFKFAKERQFYQQFEDIIISEKLHYFLDPRAPPSQS